MINSLSAAGHLVVTLKNKNLHLKNKKRSKRFAKLT